MYLADLIMNIKEGQIARATFGGERWYVKLSSGHIRYCNLSGEKIGDAIKLTPSNIKAYYNILI